jgi:hypothetical protein
MEISQESQFARIQILQQTFSVLSNFYQQKNLKIMWTKNSDDVEISPDYIWSRYASSVGEVRNNFMHTTESRLDRHKIIALTDSVILEIQPLTFAGDNFTADDRHRLNAVYAIFFGIQFLTRWHEVYFDGIFYPDKFLNSLLSTDMGYAFLQEHIKLLCVQSQQPFPVFWCSQLWFLLEQWGLTHMEYITKFPHKPSSLTPSVNSSLSE